MLPKFNHLIQSILTEDVDPSEFPEELKNLYTVWKKAIEDNENLNTPESYQKMMNASREFYMLKNKLFGSEKKEKKKQASLTAPRKQLSNIKGFAEGEPDRIFLDQVYVHLEPMIQKYKIENKYFADNFLTSRMKQIKEVNDTPAQVAQKIGYFIEVFYKNIKALADDNITALTDIHKKNEDYTEWSHKMHDLWEKTNYEIKEKGLKSLIQQYKRKLERVPNNSNTRSALASTEAELAALQQAEKEKDVIQTTTSSDMEGAEKVLDTGKYEVWKITTKEASIRHGRYTGWCISIDPRKDNPDARKDMTEEEKFAADNGQKGNQNLWHNYLEYVNYFIKDKRYFDDRQEAKSAGIDLDSEFFLGSTGPGDEGIKKRPENARIVVSILKDTITKEAPLGRL